LDDHITLVVDNHIELLRGKPQQISNFVGQGAEIPNVGYWHNQTDMAHTLAAYFLFSYLHAATVANDSFVPDTLILPAMTLIVLNRAKNTFAEQAITFRLIRPVIDCFRFNHFTA